MREVGWGSKGVGSAGVWPQPGPRGAPGPGAAPRSWAHPEARGQLFVPISVSHWPQVGVHTDTRAHTDTRTHILGGTAAA